MGVKLKGLEATLSTFREVDRRFTKAAGEEVEKGAKAIAARARAYAPEDKGDLMRSIRALRVKNSPGSYAWRVKIGGVQRGRDVDAYAYAAHEGYSTNRKSWHLSKKSRAKGARVRFMAVAFAELSPSIAQNIKRALQREASQVRRRQ